MEKTQKLSCTSGCEFCQEQDPPPGPVDLTAPKEYSCHRNPPQVTLLPMGGQFVVAAMFPQVNDRMWCAEHSQHPRNKFSAIYNPKRFDS